MDEETNFYERLLEFSDFKKVHDSSIYQPVPDDWWIIIGDIRNSTEAIEIGKYKEVNTAGASIIAAISNLYKDFGPLPFTFGGDGSTLLVPNHKINEVKKTLAFCREAVRGSYRLNMNIGMMQMSEVRSEGFDVKVAKFKLSDTNSQAVFWGNGFEYAESQIVEMENPVVHDGYKANLDGLECRWQEIPADHDEITTCIIKATGKDDIENSNIYKECLMKIEEIYGDMYNRNPISESNLIFQKNWKKLAVELKLRTWKPSIGKRIRYFWKFLFQLVTGTVLMKNKKKTRNTDWGRYKSDLIKHIDYRKFSENLKFVTSGTSEERMEMEDYLNRLHREGKLFYGIHSSSSLIVTCYITNYHREHVHFVDGTDGGYTMAAKMMKEQMNKFE